MLPLLFVAGRLGVPSGPMRALPDATPGLSIGPRPLWDKGFELLARV